MTREPNYHSHSVLPFVACCLGVTLSHARRGCCTRKITYATFSRHRAVDKYEIVQSNVLFHKRNLTLPRAGTPCRVARDSVVPRKTTCAPALGHDAYKVVSPRKFTTATCASERLA
jgi:hypothetical protein